MDNYLFTDETLDVCKRHYAGYSRQPGVPVGDFLVYVSVFCPAERVLLIIERIEKLKKIWGLTELHVSQDKVLIDLLSKNKTFQKELLNLCFDPALIHYITAHQLPSQNNEFLPIECLSIHLTLLDEVIPDNCIAVCDRLSILDKRAKNVAENPEIGWLKEDFEEYGKKFSKINPKILFKTDNSVKDRLLNLLELTDCIAWCLRRTFETLGFRDGVCIDIDKTELIRRIKEGGFQDNDIAFFKLVIKNLQLGRLHLILPENKNIKPGLTPPIPLLCL